MNKKGFSVLNAVIILIVVAIIGYFLYTKFFKKPAMDESQMQQQEEIAPPVEEQKPEATQPAPTGESEGAAEEATEQFIAIDFFASFPKSLIQ